MGLYAVTAYLALMLTINAWFEQDLQASSMSATEKLVVSTDRASKITLLGLALMPAALVLGVAVSWLRLSLAVRTALKKFRCAHR